MLEFCEETLNIAKQILLSSTGLDQIGGLYLLYALYYKIPLENIKIRVTLREWPIFLDLHSQIKEGKLYDASYIFVKLVIDNAFYHCVFPTEVNILFLFFLLAFVTLYFIAVWLRKKFQVTPRSFLR